MYNIGWPSTDISDFSKGKLETETITGGASQKNPCHVTELLCATAAHDFFNRNEFEKEKVAYLFRTVNFENNSFNFDFSDFIDNEKRFKNNLTGLYSIALLTLIYHQGIDNVEGMSGWIARMNKMKYNNYVNTIDEKFKKDLTDYFKAFLFNKDKNTGTILSGWLYQIKNSRYLDG